MFTSSKRPPQENLPENLEEEDEEEEEEEEKEDRKQKEGIGKKKKKKRETKKLGSRENFLRTLINNGDRRLRSGSDNKIQ